jgi:ribosome-associated translation inhibitor RaiA
VTQHDETKAPFAAHTIQSDKRLAGRTSALATQLEIRSGGNHVDPALHDWIHERLGRQLGKYAEQIERVQVRFGDDNGPKRGQDKSCLVHVILSKLPPVVVEMRGETEREAFDLAAKGAERATRRNMEKHGYSTHHHKHKHAGHPPAALLEAPDAADAGEDAASEDSLIGRRQGHRPQQVEALVQGSESAEGDRTVDMSALGVSADQARPGADHTATRNVKLNTAGMGYRLEDSTTGKPSRKSTRGGTNRSKHGNPLTQRTKAAVQGPKQTAMRAAARGR